MKKNSPVAIVPNNKRPAVQRVWPTQKRVRELAEELDDIVEYMKQLSAVKRELSNSASWMSEQSLKGAQNTLDWFSFTGMKNNATASKLEDKWGKVKS